MDIQSNDIKNITITDSPSIGNEIFSDDELMVCDNISKYPDISAARPDFNIAVICKAGHAEADFNGKRLTINSKQVCVCRSGVIISNIMITPDFGCEMIFVSDKLLAEVLKAQLPIWTKAFYPNPVLVFDDNVQHISLTEELHMIFANSKSPYKKEIILCMLRAGFLMMAELLEQISLRKRSEGFSHTEVVFQSFMELLSRRKVKKSEVGSYADELCVSAKYLTMVCVKQSGRSAVDWINQFVMDDVAHYLKNTELSMKEISEQLGFANHSFFGKYVKAQVGTSPAEYRKRLRGKDSPSPTLVVPDAEK